MPLYEYLCGSCGHRFERIQKFSDAPVTECPSCGGTVAKLPSSPAIQFKGSGFYITDYAKPGSRDSGATESAKDGAKDGAKDTAKTPATSTEKSTPAATPSSGSGGSESPASKPAEPAKPGKA